MKKLFILIISAALFACNSTDPDDDDVSPSTTETPAPSTDTTVVIETPKQ